MSWRLSCLAVATVLACLPITGANGQHMGMGGMGGMGSGEDAYSGSPAVSDLPVLAPEVAGAFITIDGRVERRVRPTEVRVVLAVTAEAQTAEECRKAVGATAQRLKAAWAKGGVAADKVVFDFITMLPHFEWSMENRQGHEAIVEKRVGFRLQQNAHVSVPGDPQAQAVIDAAFAEGVTDIIAFDYWSSELDAVKAKAREEALKTARDKAQAMLGGIFNPMPPVINVQEQTNVLYPASLYRAVTDRHDDTEDPNISRGWIRDSNAVMVHAYRPRNSFYAGLTIDGDIQPRESAMNPEIAVVSTVRLYYQSPAALHAKARETTPPAR